MKLNKKNLITFIKKYLKEHKLELNDITSDYLYVEKFVYEIENNFNLDWYIKLVESDCDGWCELRYNSKKLGNYTIILNSDYTLSGETIDELADDILLTDKICQDFEKELKIK